MSERQRIARAPTLEQAKNASEIGAPAILTTYAYRAHPAKHIDRKSASRAIVQRLEA
jgi:hypothetical protein